MEYQTIVTILITVLGSGGVGAYLKIYLTEKITSDIKSQYDKELEVLKSNLLQQQNLINTSIASQKDGYNLANSDRIESIKIYWKNYNKIIQSIDPVAEIDSFIKIEETGAEHFLKTEPFIEIINSLPVRDTFSVITEQAETRLIRPFVSEKLWTYFLNIVFFTSRIIYLYKNGLEEKNLKHWKHDEYLLNNISKMLTDVEYQYIMDNELNGIYGFIAFTERKILNEIEIIITGKASADYSFNHARSLIESRSFLKVPIEGF